MAKKFIINERQFKTINSYEINEGKLGKLGLGLTGLYVAAGTYMGDKNIKPNIEPNNTQNRIEVSHQDSTNNNTTDDEAINLMDVKSDADWVEIVDDAIVTVYNAEAKQCNSDFKTTASGKKLNLNNIEKHKIVAVERTFMSEFGLHYGDVIKIEGTYKGKQDGIFQIQDTMNKRFKGQHKIDVLVPSNIKVGGTLKSQKARVYVLKNKEKTNLYKQGML